MLKLSSKAVDEAVPLTKRKRIYGQPIDVSTAMIRLLGGEVLDIPSQDFNLTSGSDMHILHYIK
jgi:hypothetical protein